MKNFKKKAKRFYRELKRDLPKIVAYLFMVFLATMAVCIIFGLPDIIGALIFD